MSDIKPFSELGLSENVLEAVLALGYENPTPVQEQSIPVFLNNEDLVAQAQTGTGKTAAFALPILSSIDVSLKKPQAIVIAPTRELAIQVAEAFQSYAKNLKGFLVAPIFGGQDYNIQLRALRRGTQVIVGTPGRVMDHLRRGTIQMDDIKTVVLDEADEMLKMGFIDDIEWILEQIPHEHQTALFSATMPAPIQKIANRYLKDPQKIKIQAKAATLTNIDQSYIRVPYSQKLDVLTRFLEVEETQATIIFARTKNCTEELAEKLQARGYAASALNGDMKQTLRQKVIEKTKKGLLDIIVATDVAARGIDIERITHVINFDIPHDTESYVHRIGRTGRAGRSGTALLFVTPREFRMLKDIERATKQPIKQIEPPTLKEMNEIRSKQLTEKVTGIIAKSKKLKPFQDMVQHIMDETEAAPNDIAAALAYLLQQSNPVATAELESSESRRDRGDRGDRGGQRRDSRSNGRGRSSDGRGRSSDSRSRSSEGRGRSDRSSEGRGRSSDSRDRSSEGRGRSSDSRDRFSDSRGRSSNSQGRSSDSRGDSSDRRSLGKMKDDSRSQDKKAKKAAKKKSKVRYVSKAAQKGSEKTLRVRQEA